MQTMVKLKFGGRRPASREMKVGLKTGCFGQRSVHYSIKRERNGESEEVNDEKRDGIRRRARAYIWGPLGDD